MDVIERLSAPDTRVGRTTCPRCEAGPRHYCVPVGAEKILVFLRLRSESQLHRSRQRIVL